MSKLKLKKGEVVTINIPFSYTIGEVSSFSGRKFETIDDCKEEVLDELREGIVSADSVYLEVQK